MPPVLWITQSKVTQTLFDAVLFLVESTLDWWAGVDACSGVGDDGVCGVAQVEELHWCALGCILGDRFGGGNHAADDSPAERGPRDVPQAGPVVGHQSVVQVFGFATCWVFEVQRLVLVLGIHLIEYHASSEAAVSDPLRDLAHLRLEVTH